MRDLIQSNATVSLAVGGFVIGMLFGALIYRTNFCTMGAISDIASFGDYRRFRAWILSAATALLGTQILSAGGFVPIEKSMYLAPSLNWTGNLAGGLMFGVGMVLAGGCASKNLARTGGGDIRALLTLLVMGLFAFITLGGLFGPGRSELERLSGIDLSRWHLATQSLGEIASIGLHLSPVFGAAAASALLLASALVYCFGDAKFRASPVHIVSGVGVGLCVVAGWALTGSAYDEFAARPLAPISLTFVRPAADAVDWLERFTAGMAPGFGVASVFGVIFGAYLAAKAAGRFRITSFSGVADTRRCLSGAALMGVGGVLAMGCTVGQGITGISTLAAGSFLTAGAIVVGGFAGMRALERSLALETA